MAYLPSFVGRSLDLQEDVKTGIIKAVDGMYVVLIVIIYTRTYFTQVLTCSASPRFLDREEITKGCPSCS